ncbi:hypothetical protein EVJ58_g8095 [Rhodofomes roseus]|uniref:Major facilitator superfamily (MFS) profile domain-containing protein n=1 Tax=Rhodofomes roseus TaxID=34475 RepID=A0A4Y9Y2Q8_9APHY|nr:hypothetical protein EVJ58_g8095 [Rhodofomes roseus]
MSATSGRPSSEVEQALKGEYAPPEAMDIEDVPQSVINVPDGGVQAWLSVLGGYGSLCLHDYIRLFQLVRGIPGLLRPSRRVVPVKYQLDWVNTTVLYVLHGSTSGLLYVFCMFMLSIADPHKYYQLVLSQGVGMGIGSGLMLVPAISVQTHHWRLRRSLAMGIVMTGSGVGGVIYPIMLNRLVTGSAGFAWGVRATAFLTLGLLAIANAIMTTRLPNARQRGPGTKPDMKAIMTDGPYWLYVLGLFLVLWGMFFPYFYLQLWVNLHGLPGNLAFYTIAILNAASIFGRTLPNMLADRIGPFNVLGPVALITSALVLAMFGVKSTGAVVIFSILYGFFSGAMISLMPPAAATLANGLHEIGIRLGIGYFVSSFAMLTGTPIAGALFDDGDQWYKPIVFCTIIMFAGAACIATARSLVARRKRTQRV